MLKIESNENKIRTNVALIVSNAIRKNGNKKLNEFTEKLELKFKIYLFDCFDNPVQLKKMLIDLYPNEFEKIINDIEDECKKDSTDKPYLEFIDCLKKPLSESDSN